MIKFFFIGVTISILPLMVGAQAVPRFEASSWHQTVSLHSSFEVVFTLFDGEGSGFRPPDFSGFKVGAGPSTRINASIINGKVSQETGFAYTLYPLKAGRFRIGSASVQVGSRMLTTQPIQIEVLENHTAKRGESFVEARPAIRKAWVGQQIVLDYVIYFSDPSWSASITKESDYAGFHAIPWGNTTQGRERVDGVDYNTVTERISLYPQKSGEFAISPLELDILEWKRDAYSPFGHATRRLGISSEPLEISVMPLPPGSPASFTGGVGRFVMKAQMDKEQGTTDETFILRMTLAGNGDMKQLAAPPLALPDGLQGYDPKVTEEGAPKSYQTQTAQKSIEYLITAEQPGRYEIRPEFTYFDTDSARYVTLFAGPFAIQVAKGKAEKNKTPVADEMENTNAGKMHKRASNHPSLPYTLGAVALAALAFVVLMMRRKRNAVQIPPEPEAVGIDARHRMSLAAKHLHLGETEAFYRETALAIYAVCGEHLHIPPSEWTKERIVEALLQKGASKEISQKVLHILHSSEIALYAGMDQSEQAPNIYRTAVEIIDDISRIH